MHICPQEVIAFFIALPFIKWFIGCCKRCCTKKHTHKKKSKRRKR